MGGLLTLFDPVAVPKHDIKPSSWDSTRVRHLLGDLLELVVCSVDCGAELCESHAETCAMCRAVFCPACCRSIRSSTRKPPQRIANKIGSEKAPSPFSEQENSRRLQSQFCGVANFRRFSAESGAIPPTAHA